MPRSCWPSGAWWPRRCSAAAERTGRGRAYGSGVPPPDRLPADLVLEGGGVKGVAPVGAAVELMRRYRFERVAGSSAGAVLAAFLATGLDPDGVL